MSEQVTPRTRHGRGGWVLEDYEWYRGVARFEHAKYTPRGDRTERVELVNQPYCPEHDGWDARPTHQGVLAF